MTTHTGAQISNLITEHEAAKMAGLSVSTLRAWRNQKKGFPYVRLGKSIRYSPIAIQTWIAQNTVETSK
jgi:predicted DNA-binding transcriptional regulator AlpA